MADFEAKEVIKEFETPDGDIKILNGVNLEIEKGHNVAIVGPSGSGKSTFLHIAGTLDTATSGSISINGNSLDDLSETELATFRNHNIGFVFQEHHLLPQLTALENVLIPIVAESATTTSDVERAKELLNSVGLADRINHEPGRMSGGERQRVAVARSLIRQPSLVLADEPTGSLDHKNADIIGGLLLELQNTNDSVLICVTHSDRLARLFERNYELLEGKLTPKN